MTLDATYIALKGMKEAALAVIFEVFIQFMIPKNASSTIQVDHLEMICVIRIVKGEDESSL